MMRRQQDGPPHIIRQLLPEAWLRSVRPQYPGRCQAMRPPPRNAVKKSFERLRAPVQASSTQGKAANRAGGVKPRPWKRGETFVFGLVVRRSTGSVIAGHLSTSVPHSQPKTVDAASRSVGICTEPFANLSQSADLRWNAAGNGGSRGGRLHSPVLLQHCIQAKQRQRVRLFAGGHGPGGRWDCGVMRRQRGSERRQPTQSFLNPRLT